MQKIIDQEEELRGDIEKAKEKAQYTWQKDEIAYYFCTAHRDVFKVRFTGERWIAGNKWGYEKIYQYKYLESSGVHERELQGIYDQEDTISHGKEDKFYTEKQEAIDRGLRFIKREKNEVLKDYRQEKKRLENYATQSFTHDFDDIVQ